MTWSPPIIPATATSLFSFFFLFCGCFVTSDAWRTWTILKLANHLLWKSSPIGQFGTRERLRRHWMIFHFLGYRILAPTAKSVSTFPERPLESIRAPSHHSSLSLDAFISGARPVRPSYQQTHPSRHIVIVSLPVQMCRFR